MADKIENVEDKKDKLEEVQLAKSDLRQKLEEEKEDDEVVVGLISYFEHFTLNPNTAIGTSFSQDVFIVPISAMQDGELMLTSYEIYDSQNNLIATSDANGTIVFNSEYLELLGDSSNLLLPGDKELFLDHVDDEFLMLEGDQHEELQQKLLEANTPEEIEALKGEITEKSESDNSKNIPENEKASNDIGERITLIQKIHDPVPEIPGYQKLYLAMDNQGKFFFASFDGQSFNRAMEIPAHRESAIKVVKSQDGSDMQQYGEDVVAKAGKYALTIEGGRVNVHTSRVLPYYDESGRAILTLNEMTASRQPMTNRQTELLMEKTDKYYAAEQMDNPDLNSTRNDVSTREELEEQEALKKEQEAQYQKDSQTKEEPEGRFLGDDGGNSDPRWNF